ncbi:MAG: 4Fe-4S binding protein [bacterium]
MTHHIRQHTKTWVISRRISQIFFLLLFVYILWSTTYPLSGVLPTETIFKIDPLIMLFTSLSERIILPGIIYSIILLFLTLILGRFFCGWICPLGTAIDMAGAVKKHMPLYGAWPGVIRFIKFGILSIIAAAALLGIQIAWIFDPIVIIARVISLNLIPIVTLCFEKFFMILIQQFEFYGPVSDFYRILKSSLLGVKPYYFSSSLLILLFFALILTLVVFMKRFWCRTFCPLGALYAAAAKFSWLERTVDACTNCKKCSSRCRMGAILPDAAYRKEECILCLDCLYDCPLRITRFSFTRPISHGSISHGSISRRNFMFLIFSALSSLAFRNKKRFSRNNYRSIIRPPGSIKESAFVNRCVRCGNCMKVCVTNGLQPVFFESGLTGMWTPRLVPEIGYCEFNCTLCGEVCPTDAIEKLSKEQKQKTIIGIAVINRKICLPYAEGKECIVCEEHCPTPKKAIQLTPHKINNQVLLKPFIDEKLCIGCGICQTKCPTRPKRSVKVFTKGERPYK